MGGSGGVLSSDPAPEISHSDWATSWLYQVPPAYCLKLGHEHFLPRPFQFIMNSLSDHSTRTQSQILNIYVINKSYLKFPLLTVVKYSLWCQLLTSSVIRPLQASGIHQCHRTLTDDNATVSPLSITANQDQVQSAPHGRAQHALIYFSNALLTAHGSRLCALMYSNSTSCSANATSVRSVARVMTRGNSIASST
jgi:hypothetical protein